MFITYTEDSLMAKKHSFAKGVATGLLGTAATVAGAVFAVKKTIIEPEKKKLAFIEENRKKAARRQCKPLKVMARETWFFSAFFSFQL